MPLVGCFAAERAGRLRHVSLWWLTTVSGRPVGRYPVPGGKSTEPQLLLAVL
jgi:hypothetical protein